MKVSDEKRREVAKRLRGLDATITNRDTLEQAVDKFMKAVRGDIPFSPIRYSVRNLCGLAGILADLIDRPTCRNEEDSYDRSFLCSECGYEAWTYDDSCCDPKDFSFCPSCGAEVVE